MNKGRRARPFLFTSGCHGQRLGTPHRGRFASMTFERPIEGWLRIVSGPRGNRRYPVGAVPEHLCGKLQPPANQVAHRRLCDEEAKTKFPAGWKAPKPYLRIVAQPK
jgi:hypothetical protein